MSTTVLLVDNEDRCQIFEDSYKYDDTYFLKMAKISHSIGAQECCGGALKPQFKFDERKLINFKPQI